MVFVKLPLSYAYLSLLDLLITFLYFKPYHYVSLSIFKILLNSVKIGRFPLPTNPTNSAKMYIKSTQITVIKNKISNGALENMTANAPKTALIQ